MNKKGFVDPVLIGAAALVIVCVGVLWWSIAHFHGGGLSLFPQSPSTETSSTEQMPTSSAFAAGTNQPASATRTKTGTSNTSGACGSSMSCFIAAAQTCTPATLSWTGTIDVSSWFAENIQSNLAIRGKNASGGCMFSDYAKSATGIVTSQSQVEAQGLTVVSAQQEAQLWAKQTAGETSVCTFTSSALVQLLTDWSKGPVNASVFASGNCTSNSTPTMNINVSSSLTTNSQSKQQAPINNSGNNTGQAATIPSGVGMVTVYLYSNGDSTFSGLEFKVNSISSSQVNVTVTDHTTNESQMVTLVPNGPVIVAGHDVMVTSIQNVDNGTVNGQPIYTEEAKVNYK